MTEVKMEVSQPVAVGAFLTALARLQTADLPTTVARFMEMMGDYLFTHFNKTKFDPEFTMNPAPDVVLTRPAAPTILSEFLPDIVGDTAADAVGNFVIAGFIEVKNVRRSAELDLPRNRADLITLRLPERQSLREAEQEAAEISKSGNPNLKWNGPTYYEYFQPKSTMTTMEFLWANIGDYTTRSCRG